jgi:hypothetical protein
MHVRDEKFVQDFCRETYREENKHFSDLNIDGTYYAASHHLSS